MNIISDSDRRKYVFHLPMFTYFFAINVLPFDFVNFLLPVIIILVCEKTHLFGRISHLTLRGLPAWL